MCFARTFGHLESIAARIRKAMTFEEYHKGCWVIALVAGLMMQRRGFDSKLHTLSPDRCMHQSFSQDFGRRGRTSLFRTGLWYPTTK